MNQWKIASLLTLCAIAWGCPVKAAEKVILIYQDSEIVLAIDDLEQSAALKAVPIPNVSGAAPMQSLLSTPIKIPSEINKFLSGASGQFALQLLDSIILSQQADVQTQLNQLKTAIAASAADQRFSLMELLRRYPQDEVTLNVDQLIETANEVREFMVRSQPELRTARRILTDLFCDCPTDNPTAMDDSDSLHACLSQDGTIAIFSHDVGEP